LGGGGGTRAANSFPPVPRRETGVSLPLRRYALHTGGHRARAADAPRVVDRARIRTKRSRMEQRTAMRTHACKPAGVGLTQQARTWLVRSSAAAPRWMIRA
jgi:hypothetical protein